MAANANNSGAAPAKKGPFQWSLEETELMLDSIKGLKARLLLQGKDWEQTPQKYKIIFEEFKGLVAQKEEEEKSKYHELEEYSLKAFTAKIKAIRSKFADAVRLNKRSGMGRVLTLYYEDCSEIWGSSAAVRPIEGISSAAAASSEAPPSSPGADDADNGADDLDQSQQSTSSGGQRRATLERQLEGHRTQRIQGRLGATAQNLQYMKEDQALKREQMAQTQRHHDESTAAVNRVASALERLVEAAERGATNNAPTMYYTPPAQYIPQTQQHPQQPPTYNRQPQHAQQQPTYNPPPPLQYSQPLQHSQTLQHSHSQPLQHSELMQQVAQAVQPLQFPNSPRPSSAASSTLEQNSSPSPNHSFPHMY